MRCKMVLMNLGKAASGYGFAGKLPPVHTECRFVPVSDGSAENKAFFASTPTGELKLGIVNEAAVLGLKAGASYYIDITEAPAEVPATT